MSLIKQRESTEYVYFGITGSVPSVSAELAFLAAGVRPTAEWIVATVIANNTNPLWADAVASGATGDYFIAALVGGTYGTPDFTLTAGDYQPWLRLTDTTEQPVRIAPTTLEVQ